MHGLPPVTSSISRAAAALGCVRTVLAAAGLALLLVACSASGPEDEQEADLRAARDAAAQSTQLDDSIQPPPPGSCDATQVQGLIGQPIDAAGATQAMHDAAAASHRIIGPEQRVDAAFDGARLSIETDSKGMVTGLRCG